MPEREPHARSDGGGALAAPARDLDAAPLGAPDLDAGFDAGFDAGRLRALEARLAEARARRAPPPPLEEHYSQANVAWRMVTELVAGLALGLAIGLGLDALLGTRPVMLVLFILLGFAAGVRVMMRTAQEVGAQAERAQEGRAPAERAGARAAADGRGVERGVGRGMAMGGAGDGD